MILAEKANALIEGLARRFRGEVTLRQGPVSPYPEMAFFHARQRVFVDLVTRNEAEQLTVTRPCLPDPGRRLFDLRFFPARTADWLLRTLGLRDGREREEDEARSFRLWTADPRLARAYFLEGAHFRLRMLGEMDRPGELGVAWTPARFMVQKPVSRFDPGLLEQSVRLSLELLDRLEDGGVLPFSADGGPVPLPAAVVWDPVQGSCRVCGEELARRVVYCRTCSTPHHPDCWEYTGRCAIFACGSTRAGDRMEV